MEPIKDALSRGLGTLVPPRAVASILATLPALASAPVGSLDLVSAQEPVKQLATGVRLFGGASTPEALRNLRRSLTGSRAASPRREAVAVRSDADMLAVQGRCQALCKEFFGATDCVRLAAAASELARNTYMHAREGELTLELSEVERGIRLSIIATARPRHHGARLETRAAGVSVRVHHGSAVRPGDGDTSCGDATVVVSDGGSSLYLVIDALGHGPDAERSAQAAVLALQTLGSSLLPEAFAAVDEALAKLREVVMAGIQISEAGARFAGIGNAEVLGPPEVARPVSQVGRVGRGLRTLRETAIALPPGARWVLASDGLKARLLRTTWEATRALPPADAAARFIELAGHGNDDARALDLDLETAP